MASYVDNSFRQAVMKNPAERTSQVRPGGTWARWCLLGCAPSPPPHLPYLPLPNTVRPAHPAPPDRTSNFQLHPSSESLPLASLGLFFRLLDLLLFLPSPFLTPPEGIVHLAPPLPSRTPGPVDLGGPWREEVSPPLGWPLWPWAPSFSCMWPRLPSEFGGVGRGFAGNLCVSSAKGYPCWPSCNVNH